MLKLTVGEAVAATEAFSRLLKDKLPISASFPLSVIALAIDPSVKIFYQLRFEAFKELGTEDPEKPGTYSVTDPAQQKLLEERLVTLAAQEITLSDHDPVPVSALAGVSVALEDLLALSKIIVRNPAAP